MQLGAFRWSIAVSCLPGRMYTSEAAGPRSDPGDLLRLTGTTESTVRCMVQPEQVLSTTATTSEKVAGFVERADHYRALKEETIHLPTRHVLEQMEACYRMLAHNQQQLEALGE